MTTELDLTRSDVPLLRLLTVELRKSVDTLAGRWLLASIGIITLLWDLFLLGRPQLLHTVTFFVAGPGFIQTYLLGVLGVLLATSEWSQRTAMVTFSLVPRRWRTLLAKILAAVALTAVVFAVSLAIAALLAVVTGPSDPWDLSLGEMGQSLLVSIINTLMGVGFGLLLLNAPAAIVAFLLGPVVVSAITGIVDSLQDLVPWVNFGTAAAPLYDDVPGMLTGEQWGHLLTATIVWFVIPFAIGIWRVLNAEVK